MPSYDQLYIRKYQSGNLNIREKSVTRLNGCPEHITGDFICSRNRLSRLTNGPKQVDGNYDCSDNFLSTLDGCASHIAGFLDIRDNDITSLVGIHKIIKSCGKLYLSDYEITEGGIGLLMIENVDIISEIKSQLAPFKIIQKYRSQGTKGMMTCRAELISNGYENYAKL